ncbi:MAG: hypothetical protein M1834_008346 [Cirrosporium novae-zelandiae]|nr:MAG: hypothetical protein M1834_008346 [Cirrosporium novae-zelandiae]
MSLLPSNYVPIPSTEQDMKIASLAWGFTLGFGFLTAWKVMRQTDKIRTNSDLNKPYVWMIWLETVVCTVFSIVCWLHLNETIPPSFAFYFAMVTLWALQVQFLLQIIVNRVAVLLVDRRKAFWIKFSIAAIITAINISVYCIWIPARLQISEKYITLNNIWDRCEKVIYLIVDAALNFYFIYIVKEKLVAQGLSKYKPLVRFNILIIGFSLGMDVMIIGTMSLHNTFVYMQFHPLAYLVKLNIEMTMAELISRVSRSRQHGFRAGALSSTSENHTYPTELTSNPKSGPRSKNAGPSKTGRLTGVVSPNTQGGIHFADITSGDRKDTVNGGDGFGDMGDPFTGAGIMKTTNVVITRDEAEPKDGSSKTSVTETEMTLGGNSDGEEEKTRYGDERPFRGGRSSR